jgi:hypothetical protein
MSRYESDQFHYTADYIWQLLPYALNPNWDGTAGKVNDGNGGKSSARPSESGGLLASVIDVRRAINLAGFRYLSLEHYDPTTDDGRSRLRVLKGKLNG